MEKVYTKFGKHSSVVRAIFLLAFALSAFVARSQNTGFFNEYIPNLQQYSQQTMYINGPKMIIGGNMFAVSTQSATVMQTDTNGNFTNMWMLTSPSIELFRCRPQDANNCIVTGTMGSSCGVSGDGFIGSFNYTTGTWNGGYYYNDMAQLGGFCNGLCTFTDGIALANGDIAAVGNMDQTVQCCLGASTLGTYNCGVGTLASGGVGYLDMFFGTNSYERGNDICLIRAGANGDTATASGGDGFVRKYSLAYSGGIGCSYAGPVQPTPVGHTTGTFNYISNPAWVGDSTRQDYPVSVVEDINRNIFICGYTYNYSSNNDYEGFILKVNPLGATQWCHTFYLNATATAYEEIMNMAFVTEDGTNDIVCTMQSYQSDNTELMRISNATGSIVWAKSYAFGTQTIPWGIHLTTNKTPITGYNEYLVGTIGVNFAGAPGSYNMALLVIDDQGNLLSEIGEGMSPQDGSNYSPDVDQAGTGSYFISQNTPYTGGFTNGSLVAKINREYNTTGCATYEFPVTATVTNRAVVSGNQVICRAPVIYEVRGGATKTAFTPTVSSVTAFAPAINCLCAAIAVTASATTPTICSGGNTNITASGATSYTWSPATGLSATTGATVNASPGSTTTYTVTGTTAGACSPATATVTITVNPPPTISVTPSSATICAGGAGTSLTASGGTSYTWSPATGLSATNTATVNANPASTTTYTVTGTSGGCSNTQTVVITVNPVPVISVSPLSAIICLGSSGVGLIASGATSYTWLPATGLSCTNCGNPTANPGSSTTYTVTGTSGGCTSTQTVPITVNPPPTVTVTPTSASICTGGTGTVITAGGATTYIWAPTTGLSATNTATVTANPASTTTYTVTGTTNGCSNTASVTVTVNTTPTVSVSAGPATICSGGSSTLTASGAATYSWSTGATTSTISVSPGTTTTYTVTGTTSGCPGTPETVTVTVNPTPTVTTSAAPATICSGGSSTLTANGGTTYVWSTGATTSTISVSPTTTTTYTVTGTSSGCSGAPQTVTVTVNPTPTVTVSAGPATICSGGSSTLTANGGATYLWSTGATTSTISVSPATTTTYTVTGTTGGCSDVPQTVTVTVNPTPTVTVSAAPATICSGSSSTLTANGGATYVWSTGATTSTISVSPATTTTYTVTGTTVGCSSGPQTVTVTVNPTPTVTVSAGPATICSGNSSTLTANGGATYVWSTGATTSAISVSPATTTTYTVTGTTGGCSSGPQTVTVTVNPTPTVTVSAVPTTICAGGSSTLTANGGATYLWSTGATTSTISVSPATTTTYTVTGTTGGCSAGPQTVTVTVNPLPTVTVAPVAPTVCPGGNVTLTAGGASTYTWSPGTSLSATTGTSVVCTPGATITYTVTGTSAAGCVNTQTVTVTVASSLNVTVTPPAPFICTGGSIVLNASGAATYTWKTGAGLSCTTCPNPTANPAVTTTYTVVGTSGSCSDSANVTVTVNPTPTVSVSAPKDSICAGASATLTANGAASYTWSPGTGLSATNTTVVTASPGTTTTYTVTGNTGGCSSTDSITITVKPLPTVTATTGVLTTICKGDSITLQGGGATTYMWNPAGSVACPTCQNTNASPATTTTYTLTGTVNGCSNTATAVVFVNPPPTVTAVATTPSICSGNSTPINASGATTYTWAPGTGLSSTTGASVTATPAVTTTYTVVGTNGSGCIDSASVTVTVTPTPTVTVTPPSPGICNGDTVIMTASGATSYTWTPITGLSSTSGSIDTAAPATTTTYTITGSNGACSSTQTVTITVGALTVNATAGSPTICSGSSTTITATGAVNYTWSPATGLSSTTGSSVTANPATTTTYTIVGTSGASCKDSTKITITVTPTPTLTVLPATATICNGGSVLLSASGATTYTWSPGGGLTCTNCPNPTANPGSTVTYTVTGTTGTCSSTDSVTINVGIIALSVVPDSSSICAGGSTIVNASGASTYNWSPSTGLSSTTGSSVTANPATTTTYTVVATSVGGCKDSTNFTITVNTLPIVSVSATDTTPCNGASSILTASGAATYTWSPGTGLTSTIGSSVTADPSFTTTYTVVGTNASGCSDTAKFTLTINPLPVVTISVAGNDTVCKGQSVTLTAGGASSYVWSNGSTNTSITVIPGGTVTYTVKGSNGKCVDSASQSLFIYPPFAISMQPNDSLCAGSTTQVGVSISGGKPGYIYSWNNGLGTGSGPFFVNPASPTYYTCRVIDACGDTAKDSSLIFIYPRPSAAFAATPDTAWGGQFVSFINNSTNANTYYWNFGNGATDTIKSPYQQYATNGDYVVMLVASNSLGCKDTAYDTVYIKEGIIVPNVFTPNGDGYNDVFHVTAGGLLTYNIEIFNRWGEKVFESNSVNIDWTGRSMAGVEESDGTYYYIIKATDYKNKEYDLQGNLQLIRGK